MSTDSIEFPRDGLQTFCRKWSVRELWVFGSVVRGDARPESDLDILVDIAPGANTSTWDWPEMTDELEAIFGRRVDLVTKSVLDNPFRRESILRSHRVLYAA